MEICQQCNKEAELVQPVGELQEVCRECLLENVVYISDEILAIVGLTQSDIL